MKKEKSQIYKALKDFTLECVHGGDFDQGQSEKMTLSVLKEWWNKNKDKYENIRR
jgi:hypothetical protein